MTRHLEARQTNEGIRFKEWSAVADSYLTDELTENELRGYLLVNAVIAAIDDYEKRVNERLDRARNRGTSAYEDVAESISLNEPWRTKRQEFAEKPITPFEGIFNSEQKARYRETLEAVLKNPILASSEE